MSDVFNSFLQQPTIGNAAMSFLLLIVLAFVPFMPMPAVFTAIAINYPFIYAFSINFGGSVTGALCMYFVSRVLLKKYSERKLKSWQNNHPFLLFIKQNAFGAILLARLIPILPSAIINSIAGVFQVRFLPFFLATLLGKLPTTMLFTLAGNQLIEKNYSTLIIAIIYLLLLFLIAASIKKSWKKKSENETSH